MKNATSSVDVINQVVQKGANLGVGHVITQDQVLNGRNIKIKNETLINFASCSYLGLEIDPRLKSAALDAVMRYGTQFSSSRAFISLGLYEELESLMSELFGYPTLMAPTTTLGHMSNLPIFIKSKDAVILDHQVHASVQNTVKMVKENGVKVEIIRHNRTDYLEERIKKLKANHRKIWYMADGVYSMFGDGAPVEDLYELMNRHPQFHVYFDDAHGMSWTGQHGKGYVLNRIPYHPQMILITSLTKSFGTQGGAMVYFDEKQKALVKNCGSTLMFSSPIVPSTLGASIASAKIHLSNELPKLQKELRERMRYFVDLAHELDLPIVGAEYQTPIYYIGLGTPEITYRLAKRLMRAGFFASVAVYPSVPYNNTGLRFTINRHLTFEDIKTVLHTLSAELDKALERGNLSKEKILRSFQKHGFFKAVSQ
ncbi:MAG: aminotransferase class I/II-fold pyridoxal phosphate-dependent enzyme [Bacteroidota bacterium]